MKTIIVREAGQSFIELALLIPLVLGLAMGVIDLGFVLYAHVQVAAASGEGALVGSRYAVSGDAADPHVSTADNDNARNTAITNRVVAAMGRLNTTTPANFTPSSDITVTYHNSPGSLTRMGEDMTVRVQYRQRVLFDFLPRIINNDYIVVSSSTRVRIES